MHKTAVASSSFSVHKVWFFVFGVWSFVLTGAVSSWLGSPGALQIYRLNRLLETKQTHLNKIQEEVKGLQQEAHQLEKSRVIQQREIRRVLGYAAHDEIIFDFNTHGVL